MLRMNAGRAGAAVAALVLLGTGASLAEIRDELERAYRAEFYARPCIPANGAQVLGGYAAPTDLLDPITGDICRPRRGQNFPAPVWQE